MSDEQDNDTNAFDPDCVFCCIVRGDFGTTFIAESRRAVAFNDVAPQTPTHVLVVPKAHLADLGAVPHGQEDLLGELLGLARDVAVRAGLAGSGFRVLTNQGSDAGQSVFHLHLHVLGGRAMGTGLA